MPTLLTDGTCAYVYGPDGTPLEQLDSAGNATWHHHDQYGSTRALTNSTGAVVATFTYDPYGGLVASTGTMTTPLGWGGQYRDPESGLLYLRARYYDPSTSQFLSQDPLVVVSGSAYGYGDNDPLNTTDPTGLLCVHVPFTHDHCNSIWKQHPGIHGPLIAAVAVPLVVAGAACVVATAGICAGVTPGIAAAVSGAAGAASQTAAAQTVQDIVTPGGNPIGSPGNDPGVRLPPAGLNAAQDLFGQLSQGCSAYAGSYPGQAVTTPSGGFIGLRPVSGMGDPAIDINVPEIPRGIIDKIHFP